MGIIDKFKGAGRFMADKYQERQEYIKGREDLLEKLTMPQLEQFSDNYDIDIFYNETFEDKPRRDDYIRQVAKSEIETEKIEKYVSKLKRKEEIELTGPKTEQYISHTVFQDKVNMKQTAIGGNVHIIQNIFNDFSSTIISNLDKDLVLDSLKKIEELKQEVSREQQDKSKIEKICDWFRNNKSELVTIAMPFIQKILENI